MSCRHAHVTATEDRPLSGLLYADDLVLLSLDQRSAQQQLAALDSFCTAYGLTVNITKSATVVFNAAKAFRRGVRLQYKGQEWPVHDDYRYLGLVVSSTQGLIAGIGHLELAGRRAAVRVLQRCRELQITDLHMALSLFNNQVLPCITYGAEIWLPYMHCIMAAPFKAMQAQMERVQLWFLKRFLGLRSNTPSWVVLAESSRAPVYLYALKQVCRYWNKLVGQDDHHLAHVVFQASVQAAREGRDSWAGRVLQVLHRVGACMQPELLLDGAAPQAAAQLTFEVKEVHHAFHTGIEAWWQQWCDSDRYTLREYARQFKCRDHLNTQDNYLLQRSMPRALQRTLLLFRCFNVHLNRHTAKWQGEGHLHDRAICQCCSMEVVEDEAHVLHSCPRYQHLRQRYAVPPVPQPSYYMPATARKAAGFVKAALHLRTQPHQQGMHMQHDTDGHHEAGQAHQVVGEDHVHHMHRLPGGGPRRLPAHHGGWPLLVGALCLLAVMGICLTQFSGLRCLPGLFV